MAKEAIEARYQMKDENGNAVTDEDGKVLWDAIAVDYDFGSTLDDAIALCGEEAVHSQYKANSRVALQAIIRAKKKAGLDNTAIQAIVAAWKPGMVIEKTQIDPAVAIQNAFSTWSDEKKAKFLAKLGIAA